MFNSNCSRNYNLKYQIYITTQVTLFDAAAYSCNSLIFRSMTEQLCPPIDRFLDLVIFKEQLRLVVRSNRSRSSQVRIVAVFTF